MERKPGYIVETKSGMKGRTYHSKQAVNGKVPVYECIRSVHHEATGLDVPMEWATTGILCKREDLKFLGHID